MSAVEETKPVTTETPDVPAPVESTPVAEPSTETPVIAEPTETPAVAATEATPEAATETPAPVADVIADKKEESKIEPIYSGALGYKVHHAGFDLKSMISGPKKRYFWFGEEAATTTQNLNTYLRGEKPKFAHPAAAWSSKTGKGLLYFVKHADEKSNPAGVLLLAEVTDVIESAGLPEFSFKLDGAKHTFEAKTKEEASGWVVALKEKIEEAKSIKEEVQSSTEYKDTSAHLNKPVTAGLAAAGAASTAGAAGVAAKEEKKEEHEETPDKVEEKKESKKPKSRSVSRSNKRQSIFGNILGKKDEVEQKKEEKAEAKEEKKEEAVAPTVAATETPAAAVTEPKPEETIAPATETTDASVPTVVAPIEAAAPAEETKPVEEATPTPTKAGKRGSIFGTFFEKVRSPTHEKKESEVAPTVPPKDEVTDKELPAAPVAAETAEPIIAEPSTTEAPAEEVKAEEKIAPQPERKGSFFGKLKNDLQKLRSPSSERTPVLASEAKEEPVEETPVAAPATTEPVEAAPVAEAKPEEIVPLTEEPKVDAVNGAEKKEETPEKRRTSFFGSVKKEKTEGGESTGQKLGGLFRNPSKLIKGNKEGKKAAAPTKVEEEQTKVSDEAPKLDEPKKEAPLDTKTEEEQTQTQSIGDVVPAAVQVGQPQTVSATA